VWVAKDRSQGRLFDVLGTIVKVESDGTLGWKYTVRDINGKEIDDIEESELRPE
jgi:hypothetical protein